MNKAVPTVRVVSAAPVVLGTVWMETDLTALVSGLAMIRICKIMHGILIQTSMSVSLTMVAVNRTVITLKEVSTAFVTLDTSLTTIHSTAQVFKK